MPLGILAWAHSWVKRHHFKQLLPDGVAGVGQHSFIALTGISGVAAAEKENVLCLKSIKSHSWMKPV